MKPKLKALGQITGLVVGVGMLGFGVTAIGLPTLTSKGAETTTQPTPEVTEALSGWGARSVTPFNHDLDVATVEERIERFRAAMVNADAKTLASLSDDHLSFGHSNGQIQDKEKFLQMIITGGEVFERIDLVNRTLEVTNDVALERHIFDSDIIIDGKLVTVQLGILEVWHKNGNDWQLMARQAFKT